MFLDLLKAIPFISEAFKSDKYIQPAANAANAALDPNSPQFQKLNAANVQKGKDDLAFQIAELERQNRKNVQMGRTPLFSPEHGGEQMFRGLTQGYQDNQSNARAATIAQLTGAVPNLASIGKIQKTAGLDQATGIGRIVDSFRTKTPMEQMIYSNGGPSIAEAFQPQDENERMLEQLKKLFNTNKTSVV